MRPNAAVGPRSRSQSAFKPTLRGGNRRHLKSGASTHAPAGVVQTFLNPQFVEYGGWIFPKGDGYSYNLIKGNPGSVPRSKMNDLKQKCPTTPTDAWHTHPDPGDPDSQVNDFSNGDRNFAREQGVPVYLKTPMGPTLVVSPQGASRRVR